MRRAHRDVVGRPWSDAWQCAQLANHRRWVAVGRELHCATRDRLRQCEERCSARVRKADCADLRYTRGRDALGRWRDVREITIACMNFLTEREHESRHQRRRTFDGDLLAEHCANGELE